MDKKAQISFHISPTSGAPIFRQIMQQVERLVACDQLKGGDLLPSVNQVSKQLSVNPMTISRAYNLLHEQGVLERQRGIGMRVSDSTRKSSQERLVMLEPLIDELLAQSAQLGLDKEMLIDYLRGYQEEG
jgi:GntR family transcriptional regulator